MKIIVGSKNPVKINAVKQIFSKVYKNIQIKALKIDSGVGNQPLGLNQCYQGALNRAEKVKLKHPAADFWIGIEAGLQTFDFGTFTGGIVVILDKNNIQGIGISSQLLLPEKIVSKTSKKNELGQVLGNITQRKNIKKQEGAFGLFTNNIISRKDAYVQAVACALSRFLNKKYFQ
jgi:inosine/xanthosine triphosphatase